MQCWCECQQCGEIGITFDARIDYLCKCRHSWRYGANTPRLRRAYESAISARFEHGECPT
jgi:hypothetical protein